jgi:hypothetical protein
MAMTVFNLDPILRQIVNAKNKKFVKELQGNGMQEERIDQILCEDYHRNIYLYFPKAKILDCKKECRRLSSAMIKINSLLDDENILDAIKDPLLKELNRLRDLYDDRKWIARLDSLKEYCGPGNPKTRNQMVVFQVRLLYEYIKPFTEFSEILNGSRDLDYKSKDVFELIKELFSVSGHVQFSSWKQIKTIYGNAKRHKGPSPERPISRTKVSTYEWEKIQKAR